MSEEISGYVLDPMHYLRKERNSLLDQTEMNGKGLPDRPFTEAELTYRQKLRDLPASPEGKDATYKSIDPEKDLLEAGGELGNVTWPTKPS